MQAIILCGGLGTRLSSLYPKTPKGLVPVAGRPFLEWQIRWLIQGGVKHVHLAAGFLSESIYSWLETLKIPNISVTLSIEPQPLGTGGGLKYTESFINSEHLLVVNGDSLLPNLMFKSLKHSLLNSQADNKIRHPQLQTQYSNHAAAMAVTHIESAGRYGTVIFNDAGIITAFNEKTHQEAGWINSGVYLLHKSLLSEIPDGRKISLEVDLFPNWVRQGRLVAVPSKPPLLDMGTPEGLHQMNTYLLSHASTWHSYA